MTNLFTNVLRRLRLSRMTPQERALRQSLLVWQGTMSGEPPRILRTIIEEMTLTIPGANTDAYVEITRTEKTRPDRIAEPLRTDAPVRPPLDELQIIGEGQQRYKIAVDSEGRTYRLDRPKESSCLSALAHG